MFERLDKLAGLAEEKEINKFSFEEIVNSDPFLCNEDNPLKSNAEKSSLWEIATLLKHYLPYLSSFMNCFTQPLHLDPLRIDHYTDFSY